MEFSESEAVELVNLEDEEEMYISFQESLPFDNFNNDFLFIP